MSRGGRRDLIAKLALLSASMMLCVGFSELAIRWIFDPVNFLSPELVDDPVLGHRVESGSGGHDAWGLRNASVPDHAEIVAIGDSQTYGVSAMAFQSWPAWLARLTERSVYNMALGGWGPVQYEHLLRDRALSLDPDVVVIGLYLGNDLIDAYRVVYGLEAWADRRLAEYAHLVTPYRSVEAPSGVNAFVRFRGWVGRHSVLYRLVVSSLGQFLGRVEMRVRGRAEGIALVEDPDLVTAFTPLRRLSAVDRSRVEVREGLRLTLDAIRRIASLCEERGTELVILVIPTKELFFEDRLRGRPGLAYADEMARLLDAERVVRAELMEALDEADLTWVDPRAEMKRAAGTQPIYPSNEGGHPVSAGYRAIAAAVGAALE